MFDTIKDMFTELLNFIYAILPFFGYQYNEEEKKIEKIEA